MIADEGNVIVHDVIPELTRNLILRTRNEAGSEMLNQVQHDKIVGVANLIEG